MLDTERLGWLCPACRMVWSPSVKQCNCQVNLVQSGQLPPNQANPDPWKVKYGETAQQQVAIGHAAGLSQNGPPSQWLADAGDKANGTD